MSLWLRDEDVFPSFPVLLLLLLLGRSILSTYPACLAPSSINVDRSPTSTQCSAEDFFGLLLYSCLVVVAGQSFWALVTISLSTPPRMGMM